MTADEYLGRAAAAKDAGDLEEAIGLYTEVLRLRPTDPEALLERGNCHSQLGQFAEAAGDFRALLPHAEADFLHGVHYNLGNALIELGATEAALGEYNAATQLDPSFGWAHHGRGHALSVLGRHEESLAAYTESARLLPGQVLPLNGIAVALAELGRLPEALAAFDEVLRVEPNFTTARANRALLVRSMQHSTQ